MSSTHWFAFTHYLLVSWVLKFYVSRIILCLISFTHNIFFWDSSELLCALVFFLLCCFVCFDLVWFDPIVSFGMNRLCLVYLFIFWIWIVFCLGLLWIKLVWILIYKSLCIHTFHYLGQIWRSGIARSCSNCMMTFIENELPKQLQQFTFLPTLERIFSPRLWLSFLCFIVEFFIYFY